VTSPLDPEDLRLAVYRGFAADGRVPGIDTLAGLLRVDQATVAAGLRDLADAHHLVIDEQDRILMAHPFAAIPLGFAVMGQRTLWWGAVPGTPGAASLAASAPAPRADFRTPSARAPCPARAPNRQGPGK
jgi:hypothetical protein